MISQKNGSNSYQMHEVQQSQKQSPETWTGTQCNSAEKDTRALVKQKLNMSQQCTLAEINYCNTGLYQQELANGSREAISLLSAREATSGTHCSVLNMLVHERDGYAGERPVEGR